jgi:hypothetical protein
MASRRLESGGTGQQVGQIGAGHDDSRPDGSEAGKRQVNQSGKPPGGARCGRASSAAGLASADSELDANDVPSLAGLATRVSRPGPRHGRPIQSAPSRGRGRRHGTVVLNRKVERAVAPLNLHRSICIAQSSLRSPRPEPVIDDDWRTDGRAHAISARGLPACPDAWRRSSTRAGREGRNTWPETLSRSTAQLELTGHQVVGWSLQLATTVMVPSDSKRFMVAMSRCRIRPISSETAAKTSAGGMSRASASPHAERARANRDPHPPLRRRREP